MNDSMELELHFIFNYDFTGLATTAPHNSNLGILSCLVGTILFLGHNKKGLTEPSDNSHLMYATVLYALLLSSQKITCPGRPMAVDDFAYL